MLRNFLLEPLVMFATVLQWLILSILTGALVGSGVSLFLHGLYLFSDHPTALQWRLVLLPLGGLATGLLLYYGYKLNKTKLNDQMIAAVHEQEGKMPLKTLLIKPLAALITLSCGGSAGKEGPCSHIGASLASGLGQIFQLNSELQKRIVACGVSAAFASVFGTPIAGAIYGVEVLAVGRIRHDFLLPAIIGGVTSFQVSKYWGTVYIPYHAFFNMSFSLLLFIQIIALGVFCGLIARLYVDSMFWSRKLFLWLRDKYKIWPPLMPCIGGIIIAIISLFISTDYLGLSLPLLDRALEGQAMPYSGFFWKSTLVAITLGSGFYAGVATPQFVIGALAGNAFAHFFGLDPALGAAIGFISVLAAASNTPIAAIIMGVELFGGHSLSYISGAALSAYLLIGHRSIYPDQRLIFSKTSWIKTHANLPVGQEKLRLSYGFLRWWYQVGDPKTRQTISKHKRAKKTVYKPLHREAKHEDSKTKN